MADTAAIEEVKLLLPRDSNWTDEEIGALIDSGDTTSKVLWRYWNKAAADSAQLVSVSESGSSRDLSTIHSNAMSMAKYWADRVSEEERPETDAARRGRGYSRTARRV